MSEDAGPAERMLLLTDGVVGIAMTLLVLDIRLPEAVMEAGPGWNDLLAVREQLLGFALSFIVVALFWRAHAMKFRRLQRLTGTLFWLNTLFLLAVALVPFTTSLLAASGNGPATAIYAANMGFAAFMLGLMSVHVERQGLHGDAPVSGWHAGHLLHFLPAAVFAGSVILCFWSPVLAQYSWLLLIPAGAVAARFREGG